MRSRCEQQKHDAATCSPRAIIQDRQLAHHDAWLEDAEHLALARHLQLALGNHKQPIARLAF